MDHQTICIDPEELDPREAYRIMISIVVPRPIAWVSTIGADGSVNLAPFSFFNGVAGRPPTVMISIGRRAGNRKDTLRNAQETGEFVVHLVNRAMAEAMIYTSGDWDYEANEFELAGLATAPSVVVRPPRIANAPIAMEAKVTQIVPVEGTTSTMILGRIVRYHLQDGLLRSNGLVDAVRLDPIARLGGDEHATLGQVFEMFRPKVK